MVADVLTGFEDALRASNTQGSKSIPKKLLLSKDMRATMESLIDGGGFTTHRSDYTSKQQGDAAVLVGTVVLGEAAVWLTQRFWWEQRFGLRNGFGRSGNKF
ncbi:hypothetical protein CPB85DRAFT_1458807 [Mucidula mucida]|nr:hypothetical protein CPB85DRAFT_1458807 [Mucidula mucida]